MDKATSEGLFSACVFDMCALENDKDQDEYRCKSYEEISETCYELTNATIPNWRKQTDCR